MRGGGQEKNIRLRGVAIIRHGDYLPNTIYHPIKNERSLNYVCAAVKGRVFQQFSLG